MISFSRPIWRTVTVVLAAVLLCASSALAQTLKRRATVPAPASGATEESQTAKADDTPAQHLTTRPDTPKGAFELTEWAIFVVDPNRPNANESAAFKSTVPGFARGRRPSPTTADTMKNPSPVGVIRMKGDAEEEPIDVLLQATGGRFLAYWPQGKPRNNRQLWEKISLKEGKSKPTPVDAGNWFETLRAGGSSALSSGRWTERFLMYDVEVPFQNVLSIKAKEKASPGSYEVLNGGYALMRDVEIYAPAQPGTEGGWRIANLKELRGIKPAPAKPSATTQTTKPTTKPNSAEAAKQVFEDAPPNASVAEVKTGAGSAQSRPTTSPSTKPSTNPSTAPSGDIPKEAWKELTISKEGKTLSAAEAIAAWKPRLLEAGLISADVDVILATLKTHALDSEQLTAVYRLDPAEMDRLLPLEVVPLPAKTTRIGLVIVKNIDPAAGDRIAKLIEQLGSADWDIREKAQAKLADLGAGARPKLTEALKNSDLEIVYRAERLLESINNPQ